MSQKLIVTVCVINLLGLIVFSTVYFFNTPVIKYVDSSKLINEYVGMADARKAYQSKAAVWQSNIDTLVKEVQAEIAKYEQESPRMSAKERELTQKLIQTKQVQLSQYQKSIQEKAGQEDAEATKNVIDEINAYIKQYGETHRCTIIFAATEYGNIAYAVDELDLTNEILEGLNNKYKGSAVK
jgi:outer membrane protein